MRLIYACPIGDTPTGGVKVIYRHSEALNKIGFYSYIWHPGDADFVCSWFSHSIIRISDSDLNPNTDFIILPEIWATIYVKLLKSQGFKVGIFVQNAYFTHYNLDKNNNNAVFDSYNEADLILSISNDTSSFLKNIMKIPNSKIILQRYVVDHNFFKINNKEKLITYMPRKLPHHSERWYSAILPLLPFGWTVLPIENMNEIEVANLLSKSIIFVAFSEFEGLPVPPVEAAISGNIVIGYHGEGGKEYWNLPNFITVQQGDIQNLVFEVIKHIKIFESGQVDIDNLNLGIHSISDYFSYKIQEEMLRNLVDAVVEIGFSKY